MLALGLPLAAWLRGRLGDRLLGAGGFAVFAVASALCAAAGRARRDARPARRAGGRRGGRARRRRSRCSAAAGCGSPRPSSAPRPGRRSAARSPSSSTGARSSSSARPVAGLAAVAVLLSPRAAIAGAPPSDGRSSRVAQPEAETSHHGRRTGAWIALAAVSAALTGVLFLLVLLLVSGWSLAPLAAAAAVSVLPLAALAGARIRGAAATRASAGCALVGAGVLALAVLPEATVAWIVAPQLLAGLGMGLALPALAGELLPGAHAARGRRACSRSATPASRSRWSLLAPIAAAQLDTAVTETQERGAALVLDARLPPLEKLELAGPLVADLDPADPRDGLRRALDAQAGRFADDPAQAEEYAALTERADAMLVEGIGDAFRIPLLICGGLALLAARRRPPARRPRAHRRRRRRRRRADPARRPRRHRAARRPRARRDRRPVRRAGAARRRAGSRASCRTRRCAALDDAACRFGSSREELALALADPASARAYEREHGVDPRSFGGLLDVLGINPG